MDSHGADGFVGYKSSFEQGVLMDGSDPDINITDSTFDLLVSEDTTIDTDSASSDFWPTPIQEYWPEDITAAEGAVAIFQDLTQNSAHPFPYWNVEYFTTHVEGSQISDHANPQRQSGKGFQVMHGNEVDSNSCSSQWVTGFCHTDIDQWYNDNVFDVKLESEGTALTQVTPDPCVAVEFGEKNAQSTGSRRDSKSKPRRQQPHQVIEKRYRSKLGSKMADLKLTVPTLRAKLLGEDGRVLHGLEPAKNLRKGTVLGKTVEYIKHLEKKNSELKVELEQLK